MNHVYFFKDLFQSIPDYGKTVLLMLFNGNDVDLTFECGLLKDDLDCFWEKINFFQKNKMKSI